MKTKKTLSPVHMVIMYTCMLVNMHICKIAYVCKLTMRSYCFYTSDCCISIIHTLAIHVIFYIQNKQKGSIPKEHAYLVFKSDTSILSDRFISQKRLMDKGAVFNI